MRIRLSMNSRSARDGRRRRRLWERKRMLESELTAAVHTIFAAFARNDLDAAIVMLADDVDWHNLGPIEMGYTTPRRGRDAVREFFGEVDELFDHDQFKAEHFIAQGDQVV